MNEDFRHALAAVSLSACAVAVEFASWHSGLFWSLLRGSEVLADAVSAALGVMGLTLAAMAWLRAPRWEPVSRATAAFAILAGLVMPAAVIATWCGLLGALPR